MSSARPTAYVPGFDHDIFISYATVDNQPMAGPVGWVSGFVEKLMLRLARQLGRQDNFSLWMDRARLGGTSTLTAAIKEALDKTALLVCVVSPGYLEAKWCTEELGWFREALGKSHVKVPEGYARVFLVELEPLDAKHLPKDFNDHRAYRFWTKGPLDRYPRLLGESDQTRDSYHALIDDLARDLSEVLGGMRRYTPEPSPPAAPRQTVYLAEVTDDLLRQRQKVKAFLEQRQIDVVPKRNLTREKDEFLGQVTETLPDPEQGLFVQLLSTVAGQTMDEGGTETYVACQHALARDKEVKILQWRDPRLKEQDFEDVEPAHRDLLDGPDVHGVPLEEFMQEVLRALEQLRRDREAPRPSANVFLVADPKDREVAESISKYVEDQGHTCDLCLALVAEPDAVKPKAITEDLNAGIGGAHGTVIVYGDAPLEWCRSQLREVKKIRALLPEGQRCRVGLIVAPPPKHPSVPGIGVPGMHRIPGGKGFEDEAFKSFLQALVQTIPQPAH